MRMPSWLTEIIDPGAEVRAMQDAFLARQDRMLAEIAQTETMLRRLKGTGRPDLPADDRHSEPLYVRLSVRRAPGEFQTFVERLYPGDTLESNDDLGIFLTVDISKQPFPTEPPKPTGLRPLRREEIGAGVHDGN